MEYSGMNQECVCSWHVWVGQNASFHGYVELLNFNLIQCNASDGFIALVLIATSICCYCELSPCVGCCVGCGSKSGQRGSPWLLMSLKLFEYRFGYHGKHWVGFESRGLPNGKNNCNSQNVKLLNMQCKWLVDLDFFSRYQYNPLWVAEKVIWILHHVIVIHHEMRTVGSKCSQLLIINWGLEDKTPQLILYKKGTPSDEQKGKSRRKR